jgi:hypothetical protein
MWINRSFHLNYFFIKFKAQNIRNKAILDFISYLLSDNMKPYFNLN